MISSRAAEQLRDLQTLRVNSQRESMRLKYFSEKLSETQSAADRAQVSLGIAPDDPLLKPMLEQLGLAEQKLRRLKRDRGVDDGDVQDTANWIAELNGRIERLCRGLLAGLEYRADAMKGAAENLQAEIEKTKDVSK